VAVLYFWLDICHVSSYAVITPFSLQFDAELSFVRFSIATSSMYIDDKIWHQVRVLIPSKQANWFTLDSGHARGGSSTASSLRLSRASRVRMAGVNRPT
jgi:hypothetical protein